MKIVLKQDVRGTGKKGALVEVSDGYARNFLLPKGLAMEATPQNINAAKLKKDAEVHRDEVLHQKATQLANELNGATFIIKAKCGEGGRLFGAITTREIIDAVKERFDIELDKRRIVMDENIKRLGTYEIEIKPYANVSSKITVIVEAQ
jgi:large subunit ribosomal protein L9